MNTSQQTFMGEKSLFYKFSDFKKAVDKISSALLDDENFIKDNIASGYLGEMPFINDDYCNDKSKEKEQFDFLTKVENDGFYMDVIFDTNDLHNGSLIFVMLPNRNIVKLKSRDGITPIKT